MKKYILALGLLCLASCAGEQNQPQAYPNKPIKVIVPFDAGGGTDTFARIMKNALEENHLLPQPLVIVNRDGAGGTIGSRRAKDAKPDGYTLLLMHEALFTAKYSGQVAYGPEAFEPIAGTGEVGLVLAVQSVAPWNNLRELLAEAEARPDSIVVAANLGAPSHFLILMLEQAHPGAVFRFTQSGGGGKRFASLLGGHVQASVFSVEEFSRFQAAGLKALAVFGRKRSATIPHVPTAGEQGYQVLASNRHGWWAPLGTPPEHIQTVAAALEKAMQTPYVRQKLAEVHSDPIFVQGDELQALIDDTHARMSRVRIRRATDIPNLPLMLLMATGTLGLITAWQTWRERQMKQGVREVLANTSEQPPQQYRLAAATLGVTLVYLGLMHWEGLGFRPATVLFVLLLGYLLARGRTAGLGWLLLPAAAVLLGVGLHYLLTQLLSVDLP